MAPGNFLRVVNLNYIKSNKNRTSYINEKKKKKNTHTHIQIHKVLQFSFTNFFILKLLYDSLIINVISYISFKIIVK